MRRLTYVIGLTIDGRIAGPDDETDFFPLSEAYGAWLQEEFPETLPTHLRTRLGIDDAPPRHFDTVVMGRRTYEPALAIGMASPYAHLRQYVVSTTQPELTPEVTIVRSDPVGLVRALKTEDSPFDVCLAGGATLAGAVLPEIDRVVVKLYPVVAGAGRPAVDSGAFSPTRFDLTDVATVDGGHVVVTYDRRRDPPR
ncbi:dihydrofolate reductase family protein [Kocuria sp. M1N1S27]|uniref:dihydrofolate reductase family protein n=1 Tax=Kocuria kalidii TaxID=3376283 RepID=UPI0037AFCFD4